MCQDEGGRAVTFSRGTKKKIPDRLQLSYSNVLGAERTKDQVIGLEVETEPPRPPGPVLRGLASHHPYCTQTPGGYRMLSSGESDAAHASRVPHAGGGT